MCSSDLFPSHDTEFVVEFVEFVVETVVEFVEFEVVDVILSKKRSGRL